MTLALPADKSIAHRALLLAALSERASIVEDAGEAADVRSTLSCLRALGAAVSEQGRALTVSAPAPVSQPRASDTLVLDAGNSGTSARLLAGWLAGRRVPATVVGDASLSLRPMTRVTMPVNALFTSPVVEVSERGTLPMRVTPAPFDSSLDLVVETQLPSAQVKSAVLLAALARPGSLRLREPVPTRDHTERMLRALGVALVVVEREIRLSGPVTLEGGWRLRVPRDPSAVALLSIAAIGRRTTLVVDDVGLNPIRTAFLDVLRRMGASACVEERELRLGEPVGRIVITPTAAPLEPVHVIPSEVPGLVDEIPALAALAALARGESRFEGLGELRLKESDRLVGIAEGLRAFGVEARVQDDVLVVVGDPKRLRAAPLRSRGDHRLEMALLALAAAADLDVAQPTPSFAHISFPGFSDALHHVVGAGG